MQKFLTVLIVTMTAFVLNGCTKQDNTNECNEDIYNSKFEQIVGTTTYDDVKALIGWDGNLFRTDSIGNKLTEYYRWFTCSDTRFYIECRFTNGVIVLSRKTITNGTCTDNVTNEGFASLQNDMTYDEVKAILNNSGDHYASSYGYGTPTTIRFYRFYKCGDPSKYIEVWFNNGLAVVIQKNFA